jgi:hypothetical protein
MNIANIIVSLADGTAESIFHSFRDILLNEPFNFIEKAIKTDEWDDGLTPVQKEISCQVSNIIARAYKSLQIVDAGNEEDKLIGMWLRKLIVIHMEHLTNATQNINKKSEHTELTLRDHLYYLKPEGNA